MINLDTFIGKFVGKLLTGLQTLGSFIVARVLAAMGLSIVTFRYVLPDVKAWLADQASSLPANAIDILSAFGVDVFMTLILSAIVANVGMKAFLAATSALQGLIDQAGG